MNESSALQEPTDFSLVLGGPLYQLFRRAHLTGDALELHRRRVVIISLFAWLPLLVLSALNGQVLGGTAAVPFLMDLEVHVRFLVALPLLIVAEFVVHRRMRFVVKQFLERNVIPESARTGFDAAIASAFRLRNSVLAEVLLIALRLWRGCPHHLAPVHNDRHDYVVHGAGRDGLEALARRVVVRLRESADLPVPDVTLVFSAVHLGALSLAGVAH